MGLNGPKVVYRPLITSSDLAHDSGWNEIFFFLDITATVPDLKLGKSYFGSTLLKTSFLVSDPKCHSFHAMPPKILDTQLILFKIYMIYGKVEGIFSENCKRPIKNALPDVHSL